MDFEIPEWGNESFSYHYTSSLEQNVIDTAISSSFEKKKKKKKKLNTSDNEQLSPKKKINQNNFEASQTTKNTKQILENENEVAPKVNSKKIKKLKSNVVKSTNNEKNNPSIGESKEFQNPNSDVNESALIESTPLKKSKSKKNKKSGKNNKYKELHEKQQTDKNKLNNLSEKLQNESSVQKPNSTMAWNVSNTTTSENKTKKLPILTGSKSKENEVTKESMKSKNVFKNQKSEILETKTSQILHQSISRKPVIKNEKTENNIQSKIKTIKKKKKSKVKAETDNNEVSQEIDDVSSETKNISNEKQKKNKIKVDKNNIVSHKLDKNLEALPSTTKKRKKKAKNNTEENKPKNKKMKSVKVSIEHDMEVIEGSDEDMEDSDLKAELERYLGKLKSKTKEELFATDSEDEMSNDKGNESNDEWESLEEDNEPGDDLESSGDLVVDDLKESNVEKDIEDEMDDGNKDIQDDNDMDNEDEESFLDDEDEKDENEMDNETNDQENETDTDESDIENESNDQENEIDTDEDDNGEDDNDSEDDTDNSDNESEADMDDSTDEEQIKKKLGFVDESSETTSTKSILNENKDGKKKKFDSEKLSALLQNSESNNVAPKKLSPAEALRQKMSLQLNSARFRLINEQLYTSTGDDAKKLFGNDPEAFQVYHEGYKSQVAKWPINPLDLIIKSLKTKPADLVVADFGCGEAALSRSVPQKKVFSLDLQAACKGVIVTDMAHTPLKTASVDIAVFCLSLMGTNIKDYIVEANRVLKQEGILKIAEVESRFTGDINTFVKVLEKYGFKCTSKDTTHKYFFLFDFKKTWVPKKSLSLPEISLKPCIYKKR